MRVEYTDEELLKRTPWPAGMDEQIKRELLDTVRYFVEDSGCRPEDVLVSGCRRK